MKTYPAHYIEGQWVPAQSQEVVRVHDSSTEEVIATVPAGTADEAAAAVRAARAAFEGWAALPVATRAEYLEKISAGLKARTDELATTIAREVGMPLKLARAAGISDAAIVLDPGFGFNKETPRENLELAARFAELHALGYPLLAGTSRKRFLGAVTGREAPDRDVATAATTALLRHAGAAIFRVHNVAINRDALAVADAMLDAANHRRERDRQGE